jgi:caa(3)-type oxidase subunit IV
MSENGSQRASLWRGPVSAWVALMLLFAANLGSAYLPLGVGNVALNVAIAAAMAVVLAVFLMDLRNSILLVRIVAIAGFFWTVLMFTLTFSDYLGRN